jgi:hypothetical protein
MTHRKRPRPACHAGVPCDGADSGGLIIRLGPVASGLSIDKMQLGASQARDPFIFVVGRALIIHQQMLDVHQCRRAGENEMGHRQNLSGPRHYTMM